MASTRPVAGCRRISPAGDCDSHSHPSRSLRTVRMGCRPASGRTVHFHRPRIGLPCSNPLCEPAQMPPSPAGAICQMVALGSPSSGVKPSASSRPSQRAMPPPKMPSQSEPSRSSRIAETSCPERPSRTPTRRHCSPSRIASPCAVETRTRPCESETMRGGPELPRGSPALMSSNTVAPALRRISRLLLSTQRWPCRSLRKPAQGAAPGSWMQSDTTPRSVQTDDPWPYQTSFAVST